MLDKSTSMDRVIERVGGIVYSHKKSNNDLTSHESIRSAVQIELRKSLDDHLLNEPLPIVDINHIHEKMKVLMRLGEVNQTIVHTKEEEDQLESYRDDLVSRLSFLESSLEKSEDPFVVSLKDVNTLETIAEWRLR